MTIRDVVRAVPDLTLNVGGAANPDNRLETASRRARPITGRVRHEDKMTVYLSPEELHSLDLARLVVSRDYGLKVDRGRVVREAVAMLLADFDERGADSVLVRRLRGR